MLNSFPGFSFCQSSFELDLDYRNNDGTGNKKATTD